MTDQMTANRVNRWIGKGVVAAAILLALAPAAQGASHRKRTHHATTRLSGSIGSFTPSSADAHFGASFGRAGLSSSGFRFTPSVTPGSSRRVMVAVRARAVVPNEADRSSLTGNVGGFTPYAYNMGVAVGWKHFAVSSDYAKVDLGGVPGSREQADVALSYAGRHWSTRLALGADRSIGDVARLTGSEQGVAVDLGGSYSINSRLDVTGGLRYKMEKDRLMQFSDDRRDSQAVYIGTAFKF